MNFNLTDLKDLLLCAQENNLQCITVKEKSFELIINKETIRAHRDYDKQNPVRPVNTISNNVQKKIKKISKKNTNKLSQQTTNTKDSEIYFTIVSPMVGTFYSSPAPNESSFITLNEKVKVNQTVCIVEAMKLMNEIEAEVSGEVVEILVKDGDTIDCGQALMKIKPEE